MCSWYHPLLLSSFLHLLLLLLLLLLFLLLPPSQAQNQLVQFTGSAHVFSPYPIKTQSTTVTLPNTNIESFSRVSPVNKNEKEITYGPYSDLPAFSQAKMVLHFENNGPFIGVVSLERIIEVSHWGNIAVEEHVHIKHLGEGVCVWKAKR